jgi:hypothetical protein
MPDDHVAVRLLHFLSISSIIAPGLPGMPNDSQGCPLYDSNQKNRVPGHSRLLDAGQSGNVQYAAWSPAVNVLKYFSVLSVAILVLFLPRKLHHRAGPSRHAGRFAPDEHAVAFPEPVVRVPERRENACWRCPYMDCCGFFAFGNN